MSAKVLGLLRENALFLAVLAVLVGGFLLLRTRGSKLGSVDEFDALIAGGQPVVVEFYSNTWAPCLMAKPIVDGIERDLDGQARVVRLGVMSGLGSQVARQYNVRGVPTLIIFDGNGQPVGQSVGIPDRDAVVAQVNSLLE